MPLRILRGKGKSIDIGKIPACALAFALREHCFAESKAKSLCDWEFCITFVRFLGANGLIRV